MKYSETASGRFVRRLNRFVAEVDIGGAVERVHVKNTGRLKELLLPGAAVTLERTRNPSRKTAFSLISVQKDGRWVNIDSQAPNTVVFEALRRGQIPELSPVRSLKREVSFGGSRFDLYFEGETLKGFIEVKGVTLETDGIAKFPDAPTGRGAKHLAELAGAVRAGYAAVAFFLVQMQGCRAFAPNAAMDPAFAEALLQAKDAGVQILVYDTLVAADEMVIGRPLPME